MRYLVLVSDYDGTIATGGKQESAALSAIHLSEQVQWVPYRAPDLSR